MKHYVFSVLFFASMSFAIEQDNNENFFKSKNEDRMQSLMNQIKPGETWRHYKNKDYRIITVSCNTEDLTWYVVYEALYDNEVSKVWHRPLEMFLEDVEIDGHMIPRFKRVE